MRQYYADMFELIIDGLVNDIMTLYILIKNTITHAYHRLLAILINEIRRISNI